MRTLALFLLALALATPVLAQGDREVVPAPIDEVQVVGENTLQVVSGLPNGCHRFHEARLERDGNCLEVTVTNTRPTDPDVVCTMIYGMHTSTFPLDLDPGATYTVWVNGREALEIKG